MAWHGTARAGLMTADGIVSFRAHLHASGTVGSSVGTHEAFSLPGSLFAIEPVGANVTLSLVGVAAQRYESHMPRKRERQSRIQRACASEAERGMRMHVRVRACVSACGRARVYLCVRVFVCVRACVRVSVRV